MLLNVIKNVIKNLIQHKNYYAANKMRILQWNQDKRK
jgi:hypothetical protein